MKTTTANGQGQCALHDNWETYVSLLKQDLETQCRIANKYFLLGSGRNLDTATKADNRAQILRALLVQIGELQPSAL